MTRDKSGEMALALVGMPGAGKSLCAAHLADKGLFVLRFGALVEAEVKRRGLMVNAANERVVREDLRERHGMAAMAALSLPELEAALRTRRHIVIDGLYSFSEYLYLQERLGAELVLLAIAAPRLLRYARLATRPVRPLTAAEASERDRLEIETLEKGGPIAIADFTLVNDGAVDAMLRRLDRLLLELGFCQSRA